MFFGKYLRRREFLNQFQERPRDISDDRGYYCFVGENPVGPDYGRIVNTYKKWLGRSAKIYALGKMNEERLQGRINRLHTLRNLWQDEKYKVDCLKTGN